MPEESKEDEGVTLTYILDRTKEAFARDQISYQNYTPSEKKKPKEGEGNIDELEIDPDLILENSMEVYFEGDREVFRSIRTELGTAVHKVFEGLIKGNKEKSQLISYVSNQSDKKEITEKLLNTVADKFLGSNLWNRLENSQSQYPKQTYTEVPITIKVDQGELYAGQTFDKTCYVNGSIDLVFREDEGWTIVDYKTCAKNQVKSELVKQYQPQLDGYKEAWEKATKEKVAKTEIFFVEKG
jgi:ATP-dependent helicase/nuclease subunit A